MEHVLLGVESHQLDRGGRPDPRVAGDVVRRLTLTVSPERNLKEALSQMLRVWARVTPRYSMPAKKTVSPIANPMPMEIQNARSATITITAVRPRNPPER
jgi:hypothetical protein